MPQRVLTHQEAETVTDKVLDMVVAATLEILPDATLEEEVTILAQIMSMLAVVAQERCQALMEESHEAE